MKQRVIHAYPTEFEKYVRQFRRYISSLGERTQESYLYEISRYLQYCDLDKLDPLKVRMVDIENYFDYIYSKSKTARSNNPISKNKVLAALTKFYDMFIHYEYEEVKNNPAKRIPKVKGEKNKKPIYLTDNQMKACMAAATGRYSSRNIAMFGLMGYCGLRVSEVCNLNIEDYDRSTGKIHIVGKGNKHNYIPLPDGLMTILDKALEQRIEPYKPSERAMFISHYYRRITVRGVQKVVQQLFNAAYGEFDSNSGTFINKQSFTAHKLRHSYATLLMMNGVDIRVVKELMGHSSIETTAIYSHVVDSQKEDAVKTITF